jgi:hypothetical protein
LNDSPVVQRLPSDLQDEYKSLLARNRDEIGSVEGADTMLQMLLERWCLLYCLLRYLERTDPSDLDFQRYNQLTKIWVDVGKDLLERYKTLYHDGAAIDAVIGKMMTIVAEEVTDPEVLASIRTRLRAVANEGKEEAKSGPGKRN